MLSLHKRLLFHIFDKYFGFRDIFELSQTCKQANRLFREYFNGGSNCSLEKKYLYDYIRKKIIAKKIFRYSELVKGLPRHRQMKFNKKIAKLQNIKFDLTVVAYSPKYKIDYLICNIFRPFHKYFKVSKEEYEFIRRIRIIPFYEGRFGGVIKFKSESEKQEYSLGRLKANLPLTYCDEKILFMAMIKGKVDLVRQYIVKYAFLPSYLVAIRLYGHDHEITQLFNQKMFHAGGRIPTTLNYVFGLQILVDGHITIPGYNFYMSECRYSIKTRHLFKFIKILRVEDNAVYYQDSYFGSLDQLKNVINDLILMADTGKKNDILKYIESNYM